MSSYQEFTGRTVEEALRAARESFTVGLEDLDFEILTPGSRGVLGMGAEPARILAAPRSALGGSAPKREAAASQPLPPAPPREDRPRFDRDGDRDRGRGPRRDFGDRGPRRDDRGDRGPRPERPEHTERAERPAAPVDEFQEVAPAAAAEAPARAPRSDAPAGERPSREGGARGGRGGARTATRGGAARGGRRSSGELNDRETAEVNAARDDSTDRDEIQAADASPEALAAGKAILEELMDRLGFDVTVEVEIGDTSRLNIVGEGDEKTALGALIGHKGERLSSLQHLVNLMLSRKLGAWTRVLVDVEDYRGRRERQLRDLAARAADRVAETGRMIQLEPMTALERRWIHLALKGDPNVATQSIGEEPNRRVVIVPRQ